MEPNVGAEIQAGWYNTEVKTEGSSDNKLKKLAFEPKRAMISLDGELVKGVKFEDNFYQTETLVTHKNSGINIINNKIAIT